MSSELHFGDNLDVLRSMPSNHVDLIYLDPPFNSNADYNILYGTKRGGPSKAQSHVFEDTWKWGLDAKRALEETGKRHLEAGALLEAFQRVFPESNMLAYLSMMAVRLIEMHRVLKSSGSLYLHRDPTAGHYLKILLDTIFQPKNFQNEIVWRRTRSHNDRSLNKYGAIHDTLLFYAKDTKDKFFLVRHHDKALNAPKTHDLYTHTDGKTYRKGDCRAPGNRGPRYEWNGHTFNWRFSEEERKRLIAEDRIVYTKNGMPRILRPVSLDKGPPLQDLWSDIDALNSGSDDRRYDLHDIRRTWLGGLKRAGHWRGFVVLKCRATPLNTEDERTLQPHLDMFQTVLLPPENSHEPGNHCFAEVFVGKLPCARVTDGRGPKAVGRGGGYGFYGGNAGLGYGSGGLGLVLVIVLVIVLMRAA